MYFSKRTFTSSVLILLSLVQSSFAHDAFKSAHIAAPENYELLLENENVLVLKMILAPGERDQFHRHNNETVYFQQGGKLRIEIGSINDVVDIESTRAIENTDQYKSIESMEVSVPDGHVMWHEAWNHRVENIGETTVVAIIVEEKQKS